MPELRQDPISGQWVIIAENRAGRPEEYERTAITRVDLSCPFCRGKESLTAPALAWFGPDPKSPASWEVRVVPNKYPALSAPPDAPPTSTSPADDLADSLFRRQPGLGWHEVVVETPHHVESFSDLTENQAYWTFCAYRDRLIAHRENKDLAAAAVFKNVGPEGGASLAHSHSQIILLPQTPEILSRELAGAQQFHQRRGECIFCAVRERDEAFGARIVARSERFLLLCPYASRFAYEMWLLPRSHAARFEEADDANLRDASALLKRAICALEKVLERPAYNYVLHTSPFDTRRGEHYHWHIELFPRVSKAAGFEWGSGWYLNSVSPERAAALLRSALVESNQHHAGERGA
jgi:UDPglucose--hexose-1-phosphate uridylyltransferase